jgi:ComF family protein
VLTRLVSLLAPPLCAACGSDAGRAVPLCAACRAQMGLGGYVAAESAATRIWAAFPYDGPAGALVRSLKFGGRIPIADIAAAQLAATAPSELLAGVIVPVPLHPARLRRRGFNHSRVLADALARRIGLGVSDCLERVGDAQTQVGRGRRDRLSAMDGRIRLRRDTVVPDRALLIDDVVTTGATLTACAAALRDAGVPRVSALAYSRTRGR